MKAVLRVRVVANARRNEVAGMLGGGLKVKLQVPAVEGKANEALLEYLADRLDVPVRQIEMLSGEESRDKLVEVTGIELGEVSQRLRESL